MSIIKKYEPTKGTCKVTFSYSAAKEVKKVQLLGDFNNWDSAKAPLLKGTKGELSTVVELAAGQTYEFRYLLDGEIWDNDKSADNYVSSPFGGIQNSVIILDAVAGSTKKSTAKVAAPKAAKVAAPKVAKVAAPKAAKFAAPKAAKVDAPKVAKVAAPKVAKVAAPKVAKVVAPKAAKVSAPKAAKVAAPKAAKVAAPKAAKVVAPKVAKVVAPKVAKVAAPKATKVETK